MLSKISQYSQKKTCAGVFQVCVEGLQARYFIKKRLQHRCFPVNIAKFLRTPILKNICEWLLLIILWSPSWKSISDKCLSSQQAFVLSWWGRLKDALKTSFVFVFRRRLQNVLIKKNMFALALRLQKTSSRVKINIFVLKIRLQDVFKMFSRRLQDVLRKRLQEMFKTSSRRLAKISSRRFKGLSSS